MRTWGGTVSGWDHFHPRGCPDSYREHRAAILVSIDSHRAAASATLSFCFHLTVQCTAIEYCWWNLVAHLAADSASYSWKVDLAMLVADGSKKEGPILRMTLARFLSASGRWLRGKSGALLSPCNVWWTMRLREFPKPRTNGRCAMVLVQLWSSLVPG